MPAGESGRAATTRQRIGIVVDVGGAHWLEVQDGETVENALRRLAENARYAGRFSGPITEGRGQTEISGREEDRTGY